MTAVVVLPLGTRARPAATATAGLLYSSQVIGSGGTGTGYSFKVVSGSIAQLSLSAGGLFSGTPTSGGPLSFTVQVTDGSGATAQQPCSINVTLAPSTTCPTATAVITSPYSSQVAGSNGTGVYTWTLASGSLAPLTLSSAGLVSGTPAATGTLNFTLRITDSSGTSAQQACTITISGSVILTSVSISPNQTMLSAAFPQPAPSPFTGTLTLSFTPDPGGTNGPADYLDPAGGSLGRHCEPHRPDFQFHDRPRPLWHPRSSAAERLPERGRLRSPP